MNIYLDGKKGKILEKNRFSFIENYSFESLAIYIRLNIKVKPS